MDGLRSPTIISPASRSLDIDSVVNEKKLITEAARLLAETLNKEIASGNDTTAFSIALLLAAAKDGVDIYLNALLVGLIPFLGQIPGYFLTAFLAYFLWGKGWFLKTRIKIIWWVMAIFVDNLPAINTLPISVLTVLYAWHIIRKRAAAAQRKLKNLEKLTEKEIGELNTNIDLLDQEPSYL